MPPRGDLERDLTVGPLSVRFTGLDRPLAGTLATRWGSFWSPPARTPSCVVAVVTGEVAARLSPPASGETYRLEVSVEDGRVLARSYHFALGDLGGARWRLTIDETPREPIGRVVENAARYLLARLAAEGGGIAMHGAGVLRDGRAWIFAGPSRSGKSTAVSLSAARSLGDDFAVALPSGRGWDAVAVPFDNAEGGTPIAPGAAPLARILRLHQGDAPRLTRPRGAIAHAALMSCLAFPWALPDLSAALDGAVDRLIEADLFAELWFAPDPSFWAVLDRSL